MPAAVFVSRAGCCRSPERGGSRVDIRIFVVELRDAGGNQPMADAERRSDAKRALGIAGKIGDGAFGLVHGFENLDGAVVEDSAVLGRR